MIIPLIKKTLLLRDLCTHNCNTPVWPIGGAETSEYKQLQSEVLTDTQAIIKSLLSYSISLLTKKQLFFQPVYETVCSIFASHLTYKIGDIFGIITKRYSGGQLSSVGRPKQRGLSGRRGNARVPAPPQTTPSAIGQFVALRPFDWPPGSSLSVCCSRSPESRSACNSGLL